MRKEKIGLEFNGRKIFIEVERLSEFGKGLGLMFRRREKSPALLFDFKNPKQFHLTSLFVNFPFMILWLDEKNKIVDKTIAKPWRLHIPSKKKYYKIIEIPLNTKYGSLIEDLSTGNEKI